jgi:hypothetical protein
MIHLFDKINKMTSERDSDQDMRDEEPKKNVNLKEFVAT